MQKNRSAKKIDLSKINKNIRNSQNFNLWLKNSRSKPKYEVRKLLPLDSGINEFVDAEKYARHWGYMYYIKDDTLENNRNVKPYLYSDEILKPGNSFPKKITLNEWGI